MLELYIGSKTYSSWSLRPWLAMTHFEIPFKEIHLQLFTTDFYRVVDEVSPSRRVPALVDDGFVVWDSLAIVEYLAEKFPDLALWPKDRQARARARSVCAEMHSGFTQLRAAMPMNFNASLHGRGWNVAVQKDIDRIVSMWEALLEAHGDRFLFGDFCAADAYFAPVCGRFDTYRPALPQRIEAYRDRVLALPAMKRWIADARASFEFIPQDEPYRKTP